LHQYRENADPGLSRDAGGAPNNVAMTKRGINAARGLAWGHERGNHDLVWAED
jgi:hypothetical protein